jgi:CelD/BcsL family acetyltransferase involved in cellulose biosynthesis
MAQVSVGLERGVDLASLGGWWRELEARADCRVFLGWSWIGTWAELSGMVPQVLVAREGGRIVGLALLASAKERRHGWLAVRTLQLHATGDPAQDAITIEHNGVLVDRAVAATAPRLMLKHLLADAGDWEELHCPGVAPDFADGLPGVELRALSGSAQVDLAALRASGVPYLEQLSANTRQQIRRAMRGYGEPRLELAGSVDEALAWFDALGELHQAYWTRRGKPGAFASPFFVRFHRTLIARHFRDGLVELVRVTASDAPIGYLYNLMWRGGVDSYQSGFAYTGDARLKPGLVSHAMCIERHLAAGASRYDFLAGDARYKLSLGKSGPQLAHVVVQRPRLKFALERGLRRVKRALGA